MNTKKVLFPIILCMLVGLNSNILAQSSSSLKKNKKETTKTVSKEDSDEKEEEKFTWSYFVYDLEGKEGAYEIVPQYSKSTEYRTSSDAQTMVDKKANAMVSNRSFLTELDFLKSLQELELELVAVTNDQGKKGPFKRFYFKKKIPVTKN